MMYTIKMKFHKVEELNMVNIRSFQLACVGKSVGLQETGRSGYVGSLKFGGRLSMFGFSVHPCIWCIDFLRLALVWFTKRQPLIIFSWQLIYFSPTEDRGVGGTISVHHMLILTHYVSRE